MGYRSEVAIVTAPNVEWPQEVKEELEKYNTIQYEESRILWHNDYIKFYDEYFPHTKAWIAKLGTEIAGGYIELGEENYVDEGGDTYEYDVFITRSIST